MMITTPLEHGCRMIRAGPTSFFGLGSEDRRVATFWLLLQRLLSVLSDSWRLPAKSGQSTPLKAQVYTNQLHEASGRSSCGAPSRACRLVQKPGMPIRARFIRALNQSVYGVSREPQKWQPWDGVLQWLLSQRLQVYESERPEVYEYELHWAIGSLSARRNPKVAGTSPFLGKSSR